MDSLRGAAIFLVMLWHSSAILLLYDRSVPRWVIIVNEIFAPFRMPVLMFLSGMLVDRALKRPLGIYVTGKLRHIAWPWFVWSLVNMAVVDPAGGPLAIPTWVFSYLWFLAYILSYYLIAPFVKWLPTLTMVLGFALLSFLVSDDENRRKYCFLAVFFFLGKWASEHRHRLMRLIESPTVWLLAPVALGFGLASALLGPWRYQVLLVPFSILGILVAIKCAVVMDGPRTSWLQFMGRNSLIYYVTHFPVMVIVVRLGVGYRITESSLIPAGLVAALALGTMAARLAKTTPVRWLFEIPREALAPRRFRAALP
jgi:uncharacterized membrane protein YcfT